MPRMSRAYASFDPVTDQNQAKEGRIAAVFRFLTCRGDGTDNNMAEHSFIYQLRRAMPYVLPKKNRNVQLRIIAGLTILLAIRFMNVFSPAMLKFAVNGLASEVPAFPWPYILAYVVLRFSAAFSSDMRSQIWLPVSQHAQKSIAGAVMHQLHALSVAFHISRKTGEVIRIVERGTSAVMSLMDMLLTNIAPLVLDLMFTTIYFLISPDVGGIFVAILLVTVLAYSAATIAMAQWRRKFRREYAAIENKSTQQAMDSLLNFETVKLYGAEHAETERYVDAITESHTPAWKVRASLTAINATQSLIINTGLLISLVTAGWKVSQGSMSPGVFVMLQAYLLQLAGPLNWLGTAYSQLNASTVDAERMFGILDTPLDVKDAEDAYDLTVSAGKVEFRDVSFRYQSAQVQAKPPAAKTASKSVPDLEAGGNREGDSKDPTPDLRRGVSNISFVAEPGMKVAFVGATGAGKSTLGKLLMRFYDPDSGAIFIDGQDIKLVTQKSLRQQIGVVPQDAVLFNNSIQYNIAYGSAALEDPRNVSVQRCAEAAAAAALKDRIESFEQGWDTVVGERGLRLSGGEKQRVAIARTVLKDPKILLLDEATSALDSRIEREVCESLEAVSRSRTVLVVAHRLSTIVDSDLILVLDEGCIIERGTHQELVKQDGAYASLWRVQSEDRERVAKVSGS